MYDKALGSSSRVGTNVNQAIGVLDRWQKEGDQTNVQKFSTVLRTFDVKASNFIYTDASYIKLRNLSFSYNLPSKLITPLNIQRLRVFAQGQNLFTITKYIGPDPENATLDNLPPLRVFTFGLQVTF